MRGGAVAVQRRPFPLRDSAAELLTMLTLRRASMALVDLLRLRHRGRGVVPAGARIDGRSVGVDGVSVSPC